MRLLPPANEVCEGYVFTGVCLSTGGSAWGGVSSQADTPGQTPLRQTPPSACWYTINKRAVRIPLECILVFEK